MATPRAERAPQRAEVLHPRAVPQEGVSIAAGRSGIARHLPRGVDGNATTRPCPPACRGQSAESYRPGRPRGERERHTQGADQRRTNCACVHRAPLLRRVRSPPFRLRWACCYAPPLSDSPFVPLEVVSIRQSASFATTAADGAERHATAPIETSQCDRHGLPIRRTGKPARTASRFSPHLPRALVGAQTQECGMPQATLGRPLDEPYLRHQLRLHPLHLPHLVRRHAAAPAGRLRVRQIDEGTLIDMVWLQRLEDLATQVSNEASIPVSPCSSSTEPRPAARP